MNWASSEAVGALRFLLPGFVAAAVFYSLTSHPRPGAFGQVALALIFTGFVQVATWPILCLFPGLFGAAAEDASGKMPQLALSLATAVVMALAFAFGANSDGVHWALRKCRITRKTSYASEWYSAFSHHHDCGVVLHLKGRRRRLYGWPEEWPNQPDRGHFRISEPVWVTDNNNECMPATGVKEILIPVDRVKMVEFVPLRRSEKQRSKTWQKNPTSRRGDDPKAPSR